MKLDINEILNKPSYDWGSNTLEIYNFNKIGRFKMFERNNRNEMLPMIVLKPVNGSKKLMRRALTDVEFSQFWEHDVFSNELLYEINYLVPNDSIHCRLEVACESNSIPNEFSHTIH